MSTTLTRTVRTKTPITKCWEYLSDFSNTTEWDPGTVSCHRLDSGPNGVGAEYENVSEFRDRKTTLKYVVTAFDVRQRFTLEGENKTVQSIDDLAFSGDERGTEVVYSATFTFKGMAKLAAPLLAKPLEKLADDAQAGLQRSLDSL